MAEDNRSLLRALRAVPHMGWADRLAVARIVAVAAVVEIGLHTVPLPTLARILGVTVDFQSTTVGDPLDEPLAASTRHRIRLVRTTLSYSPTGPTCLRMSLVCARLLRALKPTVRIGVTRVDGAIKAHAWLELSGKCIDPGASDYKPIHFG